MVIALYHPWCHPQDWNGGQTKQDKTGNEHKSRHSELCEKGKQHSTARKPGLPQPGAPKSHSEAARATNLTELGNPEASNGNAM